MTFSLEFEYPPNDRNVPRYANPHPRLEAQIVQGSARYAQALETIGENAQPLQEIGLHNSDPLAPQWVNDFLPGLDAAAIYTFLRDLAPARYFEIGSGNSTRFAFRAVADGALETKILSIDPHPRTEIDALCDVLTRAPLEALEPEFWNCARPGDVVFMDGSHRVFMNNDVVTFFLDVLPSLPADVLVGVHDVYLPYDYPVQIADRYYSEQYMLAAWLLGGANVEIVLPAHWTTLHMSDRVDALWHSMSSLAGVQRHGAAFWFRTLDERAAVNCDADVVEA